WFSGPVVEPLENDDIMLPPDVEGFDSVDTARWVMRRYRTTPNDMLLRDNAPGQEQRGEADWYQGIAENRAKNVKFVRKGVRRDSDKDQSKLERDAAEGVQRDMSASVALLEDIEVEEWYIRWRMAVEDDQNAGSSENGEGQSGEEPSETESSPNARQELP